MPGIHTFYDGSTALQPLADTVGIEVDKVNFVVCMLASFPLAYVYKNVLPASKVSHHIRAVFPLVVGLAYCFFSFGRATKHILANCLISYALLYLSPPKHVHRLVFAFAMGYLLFIHFYRWMILTSYALDITGPMMIMVQKITTLGFSYHDGKARKKEELSDLQKKEAISEVPSLLDYLSYTLNFQTILSGPLNYYADYIAFVDGTHVVADKNGKMPSSTTPALKKLAASIFYISIIITLGSKYRVEDIANEEYMKLSLPVWCFWWFFTILLIRVNYYFAWTLADAICNMSGFGFSGYDKNGDPTWTLATSVDPYKVEMAQSFKDTLDGWNIMTMGWLRRVAYDRAPKSTRTMATYVLSAVWHGVSIGYYLTFFTGALITTAGATFRRCMRWRFVDKPQQKFLYDIMSFFATKVALAYTTYAFVTLNWNPAVFVYSQVYFSVHFIALAIAFALPAVFRPQKKAAQQANGQSGKATSTIEEVKKEL